MEFHGNRAWKLMPRLDTEYGRISVYKWDIFWVSTSPHTPHSPLPVMTSERSDRWRYRDSENQLSEQN